jgi:putative ABC transport system permease protein
MLESTLLCTVGGVLGTVVASVALWMGGFAIGAEGATIAFRPSADLILLGATVSGFVGIIAGLAPAIQAATVPIVTALRNE